MSSWEKSSWIWCHYELMRLYLYGQNVDVHSCRFCLHVSPIWYVQYQYSCHAPSCLHTPVSWCSHLRTCRWMRTCSAWIYRYCSRWRQLHMSHILYSQGFKGRWCIRHLPSFGFRCTLQCRSTHFAEAIEHTCNWKDPRLRKHFSGRSHVIWPKILKLKFFVLVGTF